jgi:hypothetical protein
MTFKETFLLLSAAAVTAQIFFFTLFFILPILIDFTRSAIEKHKNKNESMTADQIQEIDRLIAASKGKFFSITFEKKDGSIRTINGKDKYQRLIKGVVSPATAGLRAAGFKSAVDRNKETWFSFQPEKVKSFKCGAIEKHFVV